METPPSRLAARMRKLPHAVVADLAAEMACEEAEQAQRIADKCLAHHCPVPAWAVADVLLSPDLLPVLLESLDADDCAAAAVCQRWRQSFLAAGAQRRKWCRVSTEDWQDGLVVRIDGKDIAKVERELVDLNIPRFGDRKLEALAREEFVLCHHHLDQGSGYLDYALQHHGGTPCCGLPGTAGHNCLCSGWIYSEKVPLLCLKWRDPAGLHVFKT